jgi:hypothetical protein
MTAEGEKTRLATSMTSLPRDNDPQRSLAEMQRFHNRCFRTGRAGEPGEARGLVSLARRFPCGAAQEAGGLPKRWVMVSFQGRGLL